MSSLHGVSSLLDVIKTLKTPQQPESVPISRTFLATEYPTVVKAIRLIDDFNTQPKRRKGFNLIKRESKKHGYLYYVRYSHNGKMLPTKWNTHTNVLEEAERFAVENKTRLVEQYVRSRDVKIYDLLNDFFADPSSAYLSGNVKLSEKVCRDYNLFIRNQFVPFLKAKRIKDFDSITPHFLSDFLDTLLTRKKVKPQTANNYLKPIRRVFAFLFRKGLIKTDPCLNFRSLPVHESDLKGRGCHDLERLEGVFNVKWQNELSYILCLLIYTTGMRNCEIKTFTKDDIIKIDGCNFIQIKKSKTANGIRRVPLHNFVLQHLLDFSVKKQANEPAIGHIYDALFGEANGELAEQLNLSLDYIKKEKISFYSGRHYWKTLMSNEGLGDDIEEVFMGHKVSKEVAKRYNHKDKHGNKRLVKKAKQVFKILDMCLFKEL